MHFIKKNCVNIFLQKDQAERHLQNFIRNHFLNNPESSMRAYSYTNNRYLWYIRTCPVLYLTVNLWKLVLVVKFLDIRYLHTISKETTLIC